MRPGISSDPSAAVNGAKRSASEPLDLVDLRLGAREHRVVEVAREVERGLPQLLEARRGGATRSSASTHTSVKPARSSSSRTRSALPSANGPGRGCRGALRRRGEAALDAAPARAAAPTGCARSSPTPRARRARRGAARAASRQRGRGVGHQHVAPAAEHRVDAGERQVDPFGVEHLELDVAEAELAGARAGALEHRLGLVGDDHAAHRRHELGGEHARSRPRPAASSSTRWPGWGSIASTIQCETGAPSSRRSSCRRDPAGGRLFPALEAGAGGARLGVEAHASSLRRACPSACAGAARR